MPGIHFTDGVWAATVPFVVVVIVAVVVVKEVMVVVVLLSWLWL